MPERDERFHSRRPARREPSGSDRYQQQRHRGDGHRHDVARAETVEEGPDERAGGERERHAGRETGAAEKQNLAQDEPQHLRSARAERDADADLVRAPRDGLRSHAVEPDAGEHQRE
jgi:hypothetical protein